MRTVYLYVSKDEKSLVIFRSQAGSASKTVGKHCYNVMWTT